MRSNEMDQAVIVQSTDLDSLVSEVSSEVCRMLAEKWSVRTIESAVDRPEMADLLGVSVPTLDRLVRDGVIPSMLVASRRKFLPQVVYAALSVLRMETDENE